MNEMESILLPGEPDDVEASVPKSTLMLFAPLDKRAFGAAIGVASALLIFALTALQLIVKPEPSLELSLLSQYFAGYTVSWPGAFIGAAWVFVTGFCAGWFTAFVRNFALAISLFMLRSKAELADSRDFLDHI
ncbi:MAG TPA: hypothetical protein VF042_10465 [Gemmatimonadaceae bacterium]